MHFAWDATNLISNITGYTDFGGKGIGLHWYLRQGPTGRDFENRAPIMAMPLKISKNRSFAVKRFAKSFVRRARAISIWSAPQNPLQSETLKWEHPYFLFLPIAKKEAPIFAIHQFRHRASFLAHP